MNDTQIAELVEFVKSHSELSQIFWDRVQYFSFVNDPTDTALLIRDLSDNRGQVKTEALIEFRVLAFSIEIGPMEIRQWLSKLADVFWQNQLSIGNSTYFQIDTLGDVFIAQNEKNQYEWVTSMIFKCTK